MRDGRLNILLVEDDELDVLNLRRALVAHATSVNPLVHAPDGVAALAMLKRNDVPRKRLVIVADLRMPRMNGLEFLRALRADRELAAIPVVVLTTSVDERDRLEAYRLGAAGYMVKPVDPAEFKTCVKSFADYWTRMELPA
jgi:CheY-like chemotaxis protein